MPLYLLPHAGECVPRLFNRMRRVHHVYCSGEALLQTSFAGFAYALRLLTRIARTAHNRRTHDVRKRVLHAGPYGKLTHDGTKKYI